MKTVLYCRVSTVDQTLEHQRSQAEAAGYRFDEVVVISASDTSAVLCLQDSPATWPISVYMIILAVITLVSVYFAVETRQKVKPELAGELLQTAH
jgi:hypothetical protein